jgi:hypothetical protein
MNTTTSSGESEPPDKKEAAPLPGNAALDNETTPTSDDVELLVNTTESQALAFLPLGEMMTTNEARGCIDTINHYLDSAHAALLDLYEREGWRALGYDSWRACVVAEFGYSESHLYRLLDAARIERNICANGGDVASVPERTLRPLAKLPPERQPEAYQEALDTAPDGRLTAAHMERVVQDELRPPRIVIDVKVTIVGTASAVVVYAPVVVTGTATARVEYPPAPETKPKRQSTPRLVGAAATEAELRKHFEQEWSAVAKALRCLFNEFLPGQRVTIADWAIAQIEKYRIRLEEAA